ncbi:MAG: phosphoribosyltransferase family protein [Clostridia bacterium]|nr:phosphoribosyltransferase family protein [Clostridia bacterium]
MNIIDFIFPPKCVSCKKVLLPVPRHIRDKGGDALCSDCRAEWEKGKLELCKICGKMYIDCRCTHRLLREEGCKVLLKLCAYNKDTYTTQNRVLFCLKKYADRRCEKFLASQLSYVVERFVSSYPEYKFCIASLPRAELNTLRYGYDQGDVLAKRMSEILGIPYIKMFIRDRYSKEQKWLSVKEREENIKGAFSITKNAVSAKGRVIILVDDMVTSGASLAEAMRVLRADGFDHYIAATLMVRSNK